MVKNIIEGSWEEIVKHAAELSGRRVRVTVLDEAVSTPPPSNEQTLDKLLAGYVGSVTAPAPHNLSENVKDVFGTIVQAKHRKQQER